MNESKLNRLKEVLSIPTKSGNEDRLVKYLQNVLDEKGYDYITDDMGNILVTKGEADVYPLFLAHTDSVHSINENLTIKEVDRGGKKALTGYDPTDDSPLGCGGDDKAGVFLVLEMLDTLDVVKGAFYVSEEIGCQGSRHSVKVNKSFYENVGYAIQYDSPEGDSLSSTLMSVYLFESSDEFTGIVGETIKEYGVTKWANHPYTDIWPLLDGFDFCCLNLAAGYYSYHTSNEYVVIDDVENSYNLGLKLVELLGDKKYHRPHKKVDYSGWFTRRSTYNDNSTRNYKPYNYGYSDLYDNDDDDLLTEDMKPITEAEQERFSKLQEISFHNWTDSDWEFYEDYTGREYHLGNSGELYNMWGDDIDLIY